MWYYIFALVTFEAFASVFSFTPQQVVKSAEGLLIIEKMILKKGGKIMGKQITPMAKARLRVKKDDPTVMSNRYIERLNYTRLSYYLVNCGFFTQWSSVDDRGADFIAIKYDSSAVYRIQLKSRATLDDKYKGKDLYMAFPLDSNSPEKDWVIVSYDDLENICGHYKSYVDKGSWSTGRVSKDCRKKLVKVSIIDPVSFSWFDGQ